MASMRPTQGGLSLPALIARGNGKPCEVTIRDLSEAHCLIEETLPASEADDGMQIWIGAIGPLRAHRSAHSESEIEFDGPISAAIVDHFNS